MVKFLGACPRNKSPALALGLIPFNPLNIEIEGRLHLTIYALRGPIYETTQGICFTGWHILTDGDLSMLNSFVETHSLDLKGIL